MRILITGRHVGVTESMKAYARTKAEKLLKYFDRVTTARVTMDVEHDQHEVEMVLDVARGQTLVGKGSGLDMYAACDDAEQKLAGQLRRFKERLTDHHRGERRPEVDLSAPPPTPASKQAAEEQTYEDVIEKMRRGE